MSQPGRVHAAAISGIDTDKCYVAVEWFENNETKGKEVSVLYLEILVANGIVLCGAWMWGRRFIFLSFID